VRDRIAKACEIAHRPYSSVRLLAATKARDSDVVELALANGLQDLGENYVQELQNKAHVHGPERVRWHFIGHLQRNKARIVARLAHRIHSIDSLRLATELGRRAQEQGRTVLACVETKLGGEESKSGFAPETLIEAFDSLRAIEGLAIDGLMSLPPFREDPEDVRPYFVQLRQLRDHLQERFSHPLPELSMGMSADLEIAVEEGATWVRVGTALFGPR